jgi:hypothetical protein
VWGSPTGWGGNSRDADLPTALELRNASCVRIWWRSLRALRAACVGRLYTPTRPPAPAPVPPSPPRSTYTRPGPRATTQGLVEIRADGAWASGPIPRVPRCSGLGAHDDSLKGKQFSYLTTNSCCSMALAYDQPIPRVRLGRQPHHRFLP